MGALLPLGRQSNEGKRQCKAGDEGQDARRMRLGSSILLWVLSCGHHEVTEGIGLTKYNSLDLDTSFWAATVCRPK